MGLLDDAGSFLKTPEGIGLLSAVAGGFAGARRGTPWNNVGRAGIAGLTGYSSAQDQLMQMQQAEQMKKLRELQGQEAEMKMAEMKRASDQKMQIEALARNSVLSPQQQAIGAAGPTPEAAALIPSLKPKFDTEGFLGGLMGIDPLQAIQMKKGMQQAPIKLGPDETLLDPTTYKPLAKGAQKSDAASGLAKLVSEMNALPPDSPLRIIYQNAITKQTTHAPAASTTVKLPPMETEFGKAVGKQQGEEYANIQKAGFSASGTLNNLNRIEALLEGVATNKLAPLGKDIASLASSVGINLDPNLGQKEAIAALSNEMALKAKNSGGENMMPGAMSDPDRRFLVEMVPGLSNTPGGNRIIIETLKLKAKRDQEVSKMARAYIDKNKTLNGFSEELAAWSEKNPLFDGLVSKVMQTGVPPKGAVRRVR